MGQDAAEGGEVSQGSWWSRGESRKMVIREGRVGEVMGASLEVIGWLEV